MPMYLRNLENGLIISWEVVDWLQAETRLSRDEKNYQCFYITFPEDSRPYISLDTWSARKFGIT